MNITIHRGTDQIGGCVTEYEQYGWKLFVDYGEQLPGAPVVGELDVEGLTHGDRSKSALLITHYHGDHIGKIDRIPVDVPIYMGKLGLEIAKTLDKQLASFNEHANRILERLSSVNTFLPKETFSFGPFSIVPITIDHSAFDAYAFRIDVGNVRVFHTGDFRSHGFRSVRFDELITKYVGRVDYVVCEATNVSKNEVACQTEQELQKEYEKQFRSHKINIVYVSSTNIDRVFSLYHAAHRAGRRFFVDPYQREIMDTMIDKDNIWGKSELYRYDAVKPELLEIENRAFKYSDSFDVMLKTEGCIVLARPNLRFEHFIEHFPKDDMQIYLSMWDGYVDPEKGGESYNPKLAQAVGDDFLVMHTSGHCDMESLDRLLGMLEPKAVIPIHTDAPDEFEKLFGFKYNVVRLKDGETIAATPYHEYK
jgi:ribonuclease J